MTEDVSPAQLGHRIAQLRESAGMSQADLGLKMPSKTWSKTLLSRIESGERVVDEEELGQLLQAIGTPEALELMTTLGREWKHLRPEPWRPPLDHADQDLLWRAEEMAGTLDALANSDGISGPFRQRLVEYMEEIKRLADRLILREHQIAFIGSIGIGKSTAICRATGLETAGSQGRPEPVLETGAGGITLCDVHLGVGPGFGIIVEPRSDVDIRRDVEDFAEQLLRAQAPTAAAESDETRQTVPRELERAIKNMAGLQPSRTKDASGKRVVIDRAAELASRFAVDPGADEVAKLNARRELVVEILTRMDLPRRDRRDVWFSPGAAANEREWLRRTFAEINNGRHPEFSLPARIELVVEELVPKSDLPADLRELSIKVIDTRGIDQLTVRADLEAHLADPHTVSILCSAFNDAPSQSILQLFKRAAEVGNRQIETHCSVVVLPRPAEAMAVKDESGISVEDAEEGYELKGEQVAKALPDAQKRVPVEFFNALEDQPTRLRTHMIDRVDSTRAAFRETLEVALDGADRLLADRDKEEVLAVQREVGRLVDAWVEGHRSPPPVDGHVHDTLLTTITQVYAATVHAAVRREGEWESLSYSLRAGTWRGSASSRMAGRVGQIVQRPKWNPDCPTPASRRTALPGRPPDRAVLRRTAQEAATHRRRGVQRAA